MCCCGKAESEKGMKSKCHEARSVCFYFITCLVVSPISGNRAKKTDDDYRERQYENKNTEVVITVVVVSTLSYII